MCPVLPAQMVISAPETAQGGFLFFFLFFPENFFFHFPRLTSFFFCPYIIFTEQEAGRRCKSDSIQPRLDVRLLRPDPAEDGVAMETASAAALTYGLPGR